MSHRLNVLGASGSGVSTLGRALADALGIPFFDGDDYYHAPTDPPFQRQRSPAERRALLETDLGAHESWILAGGVMGWVPESALDFTAVVFVTTPAEIRLERLRRRERERFGSRVLSGGDMHQTHVEFLRWASRYDAGDVEGKTLDRHEEYLAHLSCPVLRVDGTQPVPLVVERVLSGLG